MIMEIERILIIQTAFIGDVILATPIIEKLHQKYPTAQIDFLVRKGNETLFGHDDRLRQVLTWDKKKSKYRSLFNLLKTIRRNNYDVVINAHRFAATGWLTWWSGAKLKIGFDKNPFSSVYDIKVPHRIEPGVHEVDRNISLIAKLTDSKRIRPSLRLGSDSEIVSQLKEVTYLVMAPATVWFTKQYPEEKWLELIQQLNFEGNIYLIGAPSDFALSDRIRKASGNDRVVNLCGKLSLLESAALMKDAAMNYVNDSAPLHLTSAVNAPVTVFYCSTIPDFGFGPLSDKSIIIETNESLSCRPCGLHGKKRCPEGHFQCGYGIEIK